MKFLLKFSKTAVVLLTATTIVAGCGGGGGSEATSTTTTTTTTATTKSLAATLSPSATSPTLSQTDCSKFTSSQTSTIGNDADTKEIDKVLSALDADAYAQFMNASDVFTWWTRSSGSQLASITNGQTVNVLTIGTGAHESIHIIDNLINGTCFTDGFQRYYIDNTTQLTALKVGDTAQYSVASSTYPTALQATRSRYATYITGLGSNSGNQFQMLLDELSAYVTGAEMEQAIYASSEHAYLLSPFSSVDINTGGMTDFMLFLQSYLSAVRSNYPSSYSAISNQPSTIAFIQYLWTKSEASLVAMYPYSVQAGGSLVVPTDVVAKIYSTTFLQELDLLGITHKSAADWSTTYLKP